MNQTLPIKPIAFVKNNLEEIKGDLWKKTVSKIVLTAEFTSESLEGIEDFSHLQIVFYFHKSKTTVTGKTYPRRNTDIPKVGIFAMRKPDRPNHIGITIVKLVKTHENTIEVLGLDAINETPILDIKPVVNRIVPQGKITQPDWIDL